MQTYQLLEKGQANIELTSNKILTTNTITVHKIKEVNGSLQLTDITPTTPTINTIAGGLMVRHTFTAPIDDCYILTMLNGLPRFFRVGVPTLRIFSYFGVAGKTVPYKLYNFDGTTNMSGTMSDLGIGIYYVTPTAPGDYIFTTDLFKPIPVHTPYVVDAVGMSGKIIFQKDQWMLCALPKPNYTIAEVVADIEAKYNVNGGDIFRIFSAFPGTQAQNSETLDYKPGVTPTGTKYNFKLVYSDGTANEITGFWAKTKNYTLTDPNELVTYDWNA